jgi:hypothetical protein
MSRKSGTTKPPEPDTTSEIPIEDQDWAEPAPKQDAAETKQDAAETKQDAAMPPDPELNSVEHEACAGALFEVRRIYLEAKGVDSNDGYDAPKAYEDVVKVMRGDAFDLDSEENRQLHGLIVRTVRSMAVALGWSGPT